MNTIPKARKKLTTAASLYLTLDRLGFRPCEMGGGFENLSLQFKVWNRETSSIESRWLRVTNEEGDSIPSPNDPSWVVGLYASDYDDAEEIESVVCKTVFQTTKAVRRLQTRG